MRLSQHLRLTRLVITSLWQKPEVRLLILAPTRNNVVYTACMSMMHDSGEPT